MLGARKEPIPTHTVVTEGHIHILCAQVLDEDGQIDNGLGLVEVESAQRHREIELLC